MDESDLNISLSTNQELVLEPGSDRAALRGYRGRLRCKCNIILGLLAIYILSYLYVFGVLLASASDSSIIQTELICMNVIFFLVDIFCVFHFVDFEEYNLGRMYYIFFPYPTLKLILILVLILAQDVVIVAGDDDSADEAAGLLYLSGFCIAFFLRICTGKLEICSQAEKTHIPV